MSKKGAEKSGRMEEEGLRGKVNRRIERGMAILSLAYQIEKADEHTYVFNSQSGSGRYVVTKNNGKWACTCPDYKFRQADCKHIHSVRMKMAMDDSLEFFDAYKEQEEQPFCIACGSYNVYNVNDVKPELSEMWHVDEMMIKTGGKWSWLWHAMDRDTRFMVANAISRTRYIEDAQRLFKIARKNAGGAKPDYVVTDGLQGYHKAFNREFYNNCNPRTKHIRSAGFIAKSNNNPVERLNETVRERDKMMRGMQNPETAKTLMSGFRDYYNFLRPHMGVGNKTPAEAAGIDLELGRMRIKNLIKQSTVGITIPIPDDLTSRHSKIY